MLTALKIMKRKEHTFLEARRDAIIINLFPFIFSLMLQDFGALSDPLELSSTVWFIYLVFRIDGTKKAITKIKRYMIILSPFYMNILGTITATYVRSLK